MSTSSHVFYKDQSTYLIIYVMILRRHSLGRGCFINIHIYIFGSAVQMSIVITSKTF